MIRKKTCLYEEIRCLSLVTQPVTLCHILNKFAYSWRKQEYVVSTSIAFLSFFKSWQRWLLMILYTSLVLQSPLFEIAQYVLAILRSILATGGRYERWSYSVQRSTHNICVSSTNLSTNDTYEIKHISSLQCIHQECHVGDTTDARQMLSYYLFIYLQIYWNFSLWWKFVQASWGNATTMVQWLKQLQLLKNSSRSWYSDSWFLHSILELLEL